MCGDINGVNATCENSGSFSCAPPPPLLGKCKKAQNKGQPFCKVRTFTVGTSFPKVDDKFKAQAKELIGISCSVAYITAVSNPNSKCFAR